MSKPKCNWCVWEWHADTKTWHCIAMFFNRNGCSSPKYEAGWYAMIRVPGHDCCFRVLPEGREPKGRP